MPPVRCIILSAAGLTAAGFTGVIRIGRIFSADSGPAGPDSPLTYSMVRMMTESTLIEKTWFALADVAGCRLAP
jgi:hypothetical protein